MGIPGWILVTIGFVIWILYKRLQSREDKEDIDKEEH